jgi:hypothetical protein
MRRVRRSGRRRFEAREMMDWARRAKEAILVALSHRRFSSWRVVGGGCVCR